MIRNLGVDGSVPTREAALTTTMFERLREIANSTPLGDLRSVNPAAAEMFDLILENIRYSRDNIDMGIIVSAT